jgi:hypothetical protein
MDNATAIAVKFAVVALLTALVLPAVAPVSYGQAVLLAAGLTAVAFPLVDVGVLSRYGNAAAVVADLVVAVLVFRYAPLVMAGTAVGWGGALAGGGAIALAEILYHTYVKRTLLARR